MKRFSSFRNAVAAVVLTRGCSYDFACGFVNGLLKSGQLTITTERKPRRERVRVVPTVSTPKLFTLFGK